MQFYTEFEILHNLRHIQHNADILAQLLLYGMALLIMPSFICIYCQSKEEEKKLGLVEKQRLCHIHRNIF